jgi:hypothetical protein
MSADTVGGNHSGLVGGVFDRLQCRGEPVRIHIAADHMSTFSGEANRTCLSNARSGARDQHHAT